MNSYTIKIIKYTKQSKLLATLFFTIICLLSSAVTANAKRYKDLRPVAKAEKDQIVTAGSLAQLDGSKSYDPEGQRLTYSWRISSKPAGSKAMLTTPTSVQTALQTDVAGLYAVSLKVGDGVVRSFPSRVAVTAITAHPHPPTNLPPIAEAGLDQAVNAGDTVQLDGSGSYDPDNESLTYQWNIQSKPADSGTAIDDSTMSQTSFVADVAGIYVVSLVVKDSNASSTPNTMTVTAREAPAPPLPANQPPVANAGADQIVTVGTLVTVNGGSSYDPDGQPLTYYWSFQSRPAGSTASLSNLLVVQNSFTGDVPGSYLISLLVSDGTATSSPSTVTVTANPISDPKPDPPTPTITGTTYYVDPTNGNDSWAGTSQTQPWRTIAKVNASSFKPGDGVLFKRGGVWREQLNISSSGNSGAMLVYGSYGTGNLPVINGGQIFGNWSQYSSNIWVCNPGFSPNPVVFNGDLYGIQKSGISSLTAEYNWCYVAPNLYVFAPSNPGSLYGSVEGGHRPYGVYMQTRSYVTIDSLKVVNAANEGIHLQSTCDHVTVQNCESSYNAVIGLGGSSDPTYNSNITVKYSKFNFNGCIGIDNNRYENNWLIQYNECAYNGQDGYHSGGAYDNNGGIYLVSTMNGNCIVEHNTCHHNGLRADGITPTKTIAGVGWGIWLDSLRTGVSHVRYNNCYANRRGGIQIEKSAGTMVYYNMCYDHTSDSEAKGITICSHDSLTSENNKVYNNTCYNNRLGIQANGFPGGGLIFINNIFKNNICWGNWRALRATYGGSNDGVSGSGNVYQNNIFGPEGSKFLEWGASEGYYYSNLASWQSASGSAGSGCLKEDPQFVDGINRNFHLQSTSPCIKKGAIVIQDATDPGALIQDFYGKPVPQPPDIGAANYAP